MLKLTGNTLANSVANTVSGTGSLNIAFATTLTLSGVLSDSAPGQLALKQSGTGTTIVTNTDTYTGVTTVSAGTMQIGNGTSGNLTGTSLTVSGTGILATDLGAAATFAQNVSLSSTTATFKAIQSGTNTLSARARGGRKTAVGTRL